MGQQMMKMEIYLAGDLYDIYYRDILTNTSRQ